METISSIISALFIAVIFLGVIVGVFVIGLIALFGMIRSLHYSRIKEAVIFALLFSFIYVGSNSFYSTITEGKSTSSVALNDKQTFVQEVVFPGESIAIELADSRIGEEGDTFYVVEEEDKIIYYVDVYDEQAFGLYRYRLETFNDDFRTSIKEETNTPQH